MKPRARQVFLLVVLLIAAAGCRAPSPPPPEPSVVVLDLPTPTPEPRRGEDGPSPVQGIGFRVPMDIEETRGAWFADVIRQPLYYLPLEVRLPAQQPVLATLIPYRPVPSVLFRVEVPFIGEGGDGEVRRAAVWAMALRAFREGDEVVIRAVEGVPSVFGNCRHFEVPAWLLESDRMEWEGAVFVRGKGFSCIPGPGIPDRLEAEDAVLMDMAETPEGPYVLYGRWSPERRYEFWMRRPDGVVEPVPVQYAIWNYVLEDGSICGVPTDPRFEAEIREGDFEKVGCFPYSIREPRKPERYVTYGPILAEDILRILNQGEVKR